MDESIILSLLIEDLETLEAGWKGKAIDGSALADDQVAIRLQKVELQKQIQTIADIRMARSISRAVQDDGTTVSILTAEERRSAQDRETACRMSGQPHHDISTPPDCRVNEDILSKFGSLNIRASDEDDDEFISCYSESINLFSEHETGESSFWAAGRNRDEHKGKGKGKGKAKNECVACSEIRDTLQAPCQHHYCKACVIRLVSDSTVDESLFPPRCCGKEMPKSLIRPFITAELATKFEKASIEFGTPYRTYCYSCGTFINPDNIQRHQAHCTVCNHDTCMLCKGHFHSGDCHKDPALETVLRLAKETGWQRCTSCHAMIERREGCNHIT